MNNKNKSKMKNVNLLLCLSLFFLFYGCKKDCVEYEDYIVDFYINHKNFEVKPPVFETVTEQFLLKEAHREGAIFETVTEQVLANEGYTSYEIADSQSIYMVTNAETNTISEITCYYFYDTTDFVTNIIPNEYQNIFRQRVAVDGTGVEIPAIYETRNYNRLISDAELVEVEGERGVNSIIFRIPDDMAIGTYLADQFLQQSISMCEEGNSFRVGE